ncbi:hypothetical protein LLH00_04060 [bacterium]|nr:hypothetical protein [bacterium]
MRQASLVLITLMYCLTYLPAKAADSATAPLSGQKIICVWSIQAHTVQDLEQAADSAAALGFNGLCWDTPGVAEVCRARGLKSWALLCPLARRPGARLQELAAGEDSLPGFDPPRIPPEQFYQYGGEPAPGNHEILDQNFTCPNDTGVVNYTLAEVQRLRESGYDGVIFDFVGYRNYHSCECPVCRARLAAWRAAHPELSDSEASGRFYAETLVALYDTLYDRTKTVAPGMTIANHIHPVYLPDLFYGLRVKVDLAGITTAWFFQPHWPLDKVRQYTRRVVEGPYSHSFTQGMPMFGFYTDGTYARDRKSAERLHQEFRILKEAGAQHLIMCELGHILRDRAAAEAVRRELRGAE